MVVTRIGDWILDGLEAYTGSSTDVHPVVVGVMVLGALLITLAFVGIGLWTYVLLAIGSLLVFLALYVAWRALRYAYRRLLNR